jgi:predicted DNA repair protein MutK
MPGASLFTLFDDIASVLDDVALMTKVASKKSAGVLGDDLALNAEQVSGVRAERELPVVWAVAKGSFINKLILIPVALALSAFAPWAILPLLMVGGAYLCFEGFEKLAHKYLYSDAEDEASHAKLVHALDDSSVDIVAFERDKIKGAIRTDFVLSGEIIIITLGTVVDAGFIRQLAVLSAIGVIMTMGVYGLVGLIVKLDDIGLYLKRGQVENKFDKIKHKIGNGFLAFAPRLMKSLTVIGTAAMFLVGGSILTHGIHFLHDPIIKFSESLSTIALIGRLLSFLVPSLVDAIVGILAGALVLGVVMIYQRMLKKLNIYKSK